MALVQLIGNGGWLFAGWMSKDRYADIVSEADSTAWNPDLCEDLSLVAEGPVPKDCSLYIDHRVESRGYSDLSSQFQVSKCASRRLPELLDHSGAAGEGLAEFFIEKEGVWATQNLYGFDLSALRLEVASILSGRSRIYKFISIFHKNRRVVESDLDYSGAWLRRNFFTEIR